MSDTFASVAIHHSNRMQRFITQVMTDGSEVEQERGTDIPLPEDIDARETENPDGVPPVATQRAQDLGELFGGPQLSSDLESPDCQMALPYHGSRASSDQYLETHPFGPHLRYLW